MNGCWLKEEEEEGGEGVRALLQILEKVWALQQNFLCTLSLLVIGNHHQQRDPGISLNNGLAQIRGLMRGFTRWWRLGGRGGEEEPSKMFGKFEEKKPPRLFWCLVELYSANCKLSPNTHSPLKICGSLVFLQLFSFKYFGQSKIPFHFRGWHGALNLDCQKQKGPKKSIFP